MASSLKELTREQAINLLKKSMSKSKSLQKKYDEAKTELKTLRATSAQSKADLTAIMEQLSKAQQDLYQTQEKHTEETKTLRKNLTTQEAEAAQEKKTLQDELTRLRTDQEGAGITPVTTAVGGLFAAITGSTAPDRTEELTKENEELQNSLQTYKNRYDDLKQEHSKLQTKFQESESAAVERKKERELDRETRRENLKIQTDILLTPTTPAPRPREFRDSATWTPAVDTPAETPTRISSGEEVAQLQQQNSELSEQLARAESTNTQTQTKVNELTAELEASHKELTDVNSALEQVNDHIQIAC